MAKMNTAPKVHLGGTVTIEVNGKNLGHARRILDPDDPKQRRRVWRAVDSGLHVVGLYATVGRARAALTRRARA